MTYSILVRDPVSGALGGAAATGSLCVGGWVLRGDVRSGLSASQGAAPSTLWGEDVLAGMRLGRSAEEAVRDVTAPDDGREWRQLSALDLIGRVGVFTGTQNTPQTASHAFDGGIVAGNMLASKAVPKAAADGFLAAGGSFAERLLAGLFAGREAGGDIRGLMSAALLILRRDAAPLTLRVDDAADPLGALQALLSRATTGAYAEWAEQVPTLTHPTRRLYGE